MVKWSFMLWQHRLIFVHVMQTFRLKWLWDDEWGHSDNKNLQLWFSAKDANPGKNKEKTFFAETAKHKYFILILLLLLKPFTGVWLTPKGDLSPECSFIFHAQLSNKCMQASTLSVTIHPQNLFHERYRAPTDFRPLRHIFVHFCGLPTAFMLHLQHYQVKRKCRQRPKWGSCFGNSQISLMV